MDKPISDKVIFYVLANCAGILLFFYLNYHVFFWKHTLIGVIQELITIPAFLGVLLASSFALVNLAKDKFAFTANSLKVLLFGVVIIAALALSF